MKNLLVFGDSITQGYFAIDNYVVRLILDYLKFTILKKEFVVVQNLGKVADTSSDLVKRIKNNIDLRDHFGDITIIISIGINDSRVNSKNEVRVSKKEYVMNLEKIYKISKKYSNNIIFVGLLRVDESKTNPCFWDKKYSYKNDLIKDYDKVLKQFTRDKGLIYVDVSKKINNNLLIDGLHPNGKGHKIIYSLIKNKIGLA